MTIQQVADGGIEKLEAQLHDARVGIVALLFLVAVLSCALVATWRKRR